MENGRLAAFICVYLINNIFIIINYLHYYKKYANNIIFYVLFYRIMSYHLIVIAMMFVIAISWYYYRRYYCSDNKPKAESFVNPTVYEPELASAISKSEFIGMPNVILPPWGLSEGAYVDALDDGDMGNAGLHYNLCSKSCCAPQFPPPFGMEGDELTEKHKGEFVESSYMCNNAWQDSGCMCMTKKQSEFMASRGGNA
jgi:hypothetical protein